MRGADEDELAAVEGVDVVATSGAVAMEADDDAAALPGIEGGPVKRVSRKSPKSEVWCMT